MNQTQPIRRSALSAAAATPLVSSLLAILLAFIAGGIFLELRGKDALNAYDILIDRGLGTSYGLTETFKKMAPVLIVGAGLLISLKAGVWNIGIDGQFLVGALVVGVIAPELVGNVPNAVMLIVAALGGFAGGLAWAIVPALLRVRFGLNEIITTLMMNYVALNFTSWLVKGPVKDPKSVPPQTKLVPPDQWLPDVPGTDIHVGLIVGLVVVLLVAVLFRYTVLGFMLSVLGKNQRAAIHAGLPVGRLTILALLLSGGFAGLAGANDVLGVQGLFKGNWDPGYGFTAFALVYLARLHSLFLVPFAFFFSFLIIGGNLMTRPAQIPTYYVEILEGLMLVFFAVAVYLERRFASRFSRGTAPSSVGEGPVPSRRPRDDRHSDPGKPAGIPTSLSASGRWEATGASPTDDELSPLLTSGEPR